MKKKLVVAGLCGVVCLLLGAVAVESVDRFVIEPKTVSSFSEILDRYLEARESMPPLPLPMGADDVLSRMEVDDFSFLNDHWFVSQSDSTLYVADDSKLSKTLKLPLEIMAMEDLHRGEITLYAMTKKGDWKGLALFAAPPVVDETTSFYATLSVAEKEQDLFWNLNATRVRWHVTLKSESEAWNDFLKVEQAESQAVMPEGMMAMMSVPPEHTNDIWISGDPSGNDMDIEVYCPSGVTNIEIYRCTNLVEAGWYVEKDGLMAVNTNTVYWTASTQTETGFFRAGNGGLDSDGDGLPDAREKYIHKTDPNDADTDGDEIPDGWEIQYEFNPLLYADGTGDFDSDGLNNADEYLNGTEPDDSDSDDDGMPDGWEVDNSLNPLVDDSAGNPDSDDLANQQEYLLGRNPQAGVTNGMAEALSLTLYISFDE